jgi:hypothetical protein
MVGFADMMASLRVLVNGRRHTYTPSPVSRLTESESSDYTVPLIEDTTQRRLRWPNRDRSLLKITMAVISVALIVYFVASFA